MAFGIKNSSKSLQVQLNGVFVSFANFVGPFGGRSCVFEIKIHCSKDFETHQPNMCLLTFTILARFFFETQSTNHVFWVFFFTGFPLVPVPNKWQSPCCTSVPHSPPLGPSSVHWTYHTGPGCKTQTQSVALPRP